MSETFSFSCSQCVNLKGDAADRLGYRRDKCSLNHPHDYNGRLLDLVNRRSCVHKQTTVQYLYAAILPYLVPP